MVVSLATVLLVAERWLYFLVAAHNLWLNLLRSCIQLLGLAYREYKGYWPGSGSWRVWVPGLGLWPWVWVPGGRGSPDPDLCPVVSGPDPGRTPLVRVPGLDSDDPSRAEIPLACLFLLASSLACFAASVCVRFARHCCCCQPPPATAAHRHPHGFRAGHNRFLECP